MAGFDKAQVKCYGIKARTDRKGNVAVTSEISLGASSKCPFLKATVTYTVDGCGTLTVKTDAEKLTDLFLPKFGYEIVMPENSESYSYFGCGPYESYRDKHLSSRLSLFRTTASENFEDYIFPQENSLHFGCRFASVTHPNGIGLAARCEKGDFYFGVSHYSVDELTEKKHNFELDPSPLTFVRLDVEHSGVGSNSCGPALDERHRVLPESIDFVFTLFPYHAGDERKF